MGSSGAFSLVGRLCGLFRPYLAVRHAHTYLLLFGGGQTPTGPATASVTPSTTTKTTKTTVATGTAATTATRTAATTAAAETATANYAASQATAAATIAAAAAAAKKAGRLGQITRQAREHKRFRVFHQRQWIIWYHDLGNNRQPAAYLHASM